MPKRSSESLPIVLVPGLNCSARLYGEQIPVLWPFGPVTVADHTRGDSMAAIAAGILAAAPPRFALAGLSMGGYIALEIVRQAAERVAKLALLDTASQPETPEQTAKRIPLIELAKCGRFAEVPERQFPIFVHRHRHGDERLKTIVRLMAEETGPELFYASKLLSSAAKMRVPALLPLPVRPLSWSATAMSSHRRFCRRKSPPAFPARVWSSSPTADTYRRWSGRKR